VSTVDCVVTSTTTMKVSTDEAKRIVRELSTVTNILVLSTDGESLVIFDDLQVWTYRRAEQVAMMLNAADLFVLASRSEGWCNAIAEALACGCPVVATDVGGNREIVVDPSLGLLVNQQAGTELEPCIVDALSRSWDRARIAETGGKRTWQQVAEECVDVFNGVLKRDSPRTPGNE